MNFTVAGVLDAFDQAERLHYQPAIRSGSFVSRDLTKPLTCCAVGAVALAVNDRPGSGYEDLIKLGYHPAALAGLSSGWEGAHSNLEDDGIFKENYQVGQRVREIMLATSRAIVVNRAR